MLDTTPLDEAVERLADHLRRLPESRLLGRAAPAGQALARELAARAQHLEDPGGQPRPLPDAGPFATGDQVAVTGHELSAALRARGTAEQLAEAVELVADAARTVHGAGR